MGNNPSTPTGSAVVVAPGDWSAVASSLTFASRYDYLEYLLSLNWPLHAYGPLKEELFNHSRVHPPTTPSTILTDASQGHRHHSIRSGSSGPITNMSVLNSPSREWRVHAQNPHLVFDRWHRRASQAAPAIPSSESAPSPTAIDPLLSGVMPGAMPSDAESLRSQETTQKPTQMRSSINQSATFAKIQERQKDLNVRRACAETEFATAVAQVLAKQRVIRNLEAEQCALQAKLGEAARAARGQQAGWDDGNRADDNGEAEGGAILGGGRKKVHGRGRKGTDDRWNVETD